ncbi:MAG: dienelactone hydrolase [Nocardioidaceae bacterium]|jgi:hypothetical protein|nr:dienelactone hydrolase [Nocardioidaceae bacterium]
MTTIALFHSVLGVRPGVLDAAHLLHAAGHDVHVVDQYGGKVFDDYDEAGKLADQIGAHGVRCRGRAGAARAASAEVAAGS